MARPAQQVSVAVSAPAPTQGIDDISPLANMPEGVCIVSLNWFPGTDSMKLRSGYAEWVTGIGSPVVRLIKYAGLDGLVKMFATTAAGIYDVTDSSTSPPFMLTMRTGNVSSVHFANTGGNYLVVANDASDPISYYDGISFKVFSTVPPGTPAAIGLVEGVDVTALSFVTSFKRRLWFVQQNTMSAWYLPTDALGGEAKEFILGGVFTKGGFLFDIETWSLDSGSGMDDMLVFRSTQGEVAIYQGDDPEDAETWKLVSVYFVSAPMGRRASVEVGGDIVMLTRAGLLPLSKVVKGVATEALYESTLSRNISKTLARLARESFDSGASWELWNIPTLQALLVNIPENGAIDAQQFLMNTVTGAWTRYDLPATCFNVIKDVPYFGTSDGRVMVHTVGKNYLDGVLLDGTGGVAISSTLFTAYSYLGDPTALKHFKMVRPIFQCAVAPTVSLAVSVDYDFDKVDLYSTPTLASIDLSNWDVALWDQGKWAGLNSVFRPWTSVTGLGYAGALVMKLSNRTATSFVAFEVVYERGGIV